MDVDGSERWLLPEGVREVLPPQARQLEQMRRTALDLFDAWGYELVMPPLMEYVDSLLAGVGADLELQTFKVIDQDTGRLMGIRADMTPQVARIDVRHLAKADEPVRLCYVGTVLNARPAQGFGSRSPMQIGAELYGHLGVDSDVESVSLAMALLCALGIPRVQLDIGHCGVYRAICDGLGFDPDQEAALFSALQRKSPGDIEAVLGAVSGVSPAHGEAIVELHELHGSHEVLARARKLVGACRSLDAAAYLARSIDELEALAAALAHRHAEVELTFDLAELRGYRYHGGIEFSGYARGFGQEIVRGGRYDQAAEVFGRARPATGFSADLGLLAALTELPEPARRGAIFAPRGRDPALLGKVAALRQAGERVVEELSGQTAQPAALGCDRILVEQGEGWVVEPVTPGSNT